MPRRRAALVGLVVLSAGLAGCLSGDESASPASTDEPPTTFANETAPSSVPLREEGTLPAGAHAEGHTVPVGTFDRWFELEVEGTVTGANLTMTWEASNPTMETLLIGFGPLERSDGNAHAGSGAVVATGTSPLTLSIEDVAWTNGEYVAWAWWDPATEPQASAVDQPFAIEGEIEVSGS